MKIAIFTDTYIPDKNGVSTSIRQIKAGLEKKAMLFISFVHNPKE